MSNPIEEAILRHIQEGSQVSLWYLYNVLLAESLVVPISGELREDEAGQTKVTVVCVRLPDGKGCIPAFTSDTRLFEWKPSGCQVMEIPTRTLFEMAVGMSHADCIYLNLSERQETPRGIISRLEFELLAQDIYPS